jgi:hypothetical protein
MFKKKQAMKRGGAVKKRGGGMMGPKKKMARGGAVAKARDRKPSGRLTSDDVKRAMPTGRSAAAKKIAMKGVKTKGRTMLSKFKQGKGNPAGKDLSMLGTIKSFLKKGPKPKSMDMAPRPKGPKKTPGIGTLLKRRRQLGGKK